MNQNMLGIVAAGLLAATVWTANAASRSWIGGSGAWDDTTAANWSPAGVITNTDTVNISQAGVTIAYTATNLTGQGLSDCHLMNVGTGTTTFALDNTDFLPIRLVLSVGRYSSNACTFNLTGNALLTLYGGGSGLILGGSGGAGPFVFNQSGGIFSNGIGSGSLVYIFSNATYNLSGGSYIANRNLDLHGGAFLQSGGTLTIADSYGMTLNAFSTFVLSTGTFNQGGAAILMGTNASVNWTGGSLLGQMGKIKTTGPDASWTMHGGTSTVNKSGNTSASKDSLFLVPSSTIQGYGAIQDARFGASSPATFDNSGRVIANGYGMDRTFDLSRFGQTTANPMITNTTDNTGSNGWFAINQGRLLLPAIAVAAGSSATNWGESIADTSLDLVNSARLSFTGATAGNLTGTLYAVDCPAVPSGLRKPVGIWSFGGVTCTAAVVTFRYDNAAAAAQGVAEDDLRVWKYNGANWVNVTDTRDTTAKTITSQSITSWPKATTFFAVANKPPAKGTMMVVR